VRAPKEVLHELQFFMELLHGGVWGAEFVEQCQTPLSASRLVVQTQTSISIRDYLSLDGDASGTQRIYTGSGRECPTSSETEGLYCLAPKGACSRGYKQVAREG